MAKVTITFEDGNEEGVVHTKVEFDPPAEAGDIPTHAQAFGMHVLEAIHEQA